MRTVAPVLPYSRYSGLLVPPVRAYGTLSLCVLPCAACTGAAPMESFARVADTLPRARPLRNQQLDPARAQRASVHDSACSIGLARDRAVPQLALEQP